MVKLTALISLPLVNAKTKRTKLHEAVCRPWWMVHFIQYCLASAIKFDTSVSAAFSPPHLSTLPLQLDVGMWQSFVEHKNQWKNSHSLSTKCITWWNLCLMSQSAATIKTFIFKLFLDGNNLLNWNSKTNLKSSQFSNVKVAT